MFPYLYSLAHEASSQALPVIRAMPLAFPDDPNTYDKDLQFMLGKWFLVAPVYNKNNSRFVYLPKGTWIDFFDGKIYSGPDSIWIEVPLEKLPLFVRQGAIIPMMQKSMRIPLDEVDPLILEIYPSTKSDYKFYSETGISKFYSKQSDHAIEFHIDGNESRSYSLRFRLVKKIKEVFLEEDKEITPGCNLNFKQDTGYLEIHLDQIKKGKIVIKL